ncbi:MAG: glycosyltransferase family 4 protein [Butyrivibrio sp.]|nr:glycosyltransferase family 4 protein [Butyrivibrio sp.]
MKVLVAADAHLYRTSDNKVWAKTIYGYDFWKRYLSVFDEVVVVARIKDVDYLDYDNYILSSGPNVQFEKLPMVIGSVNRFMYLAKMPQIEKIAKRIVRNVDCAVFRMPALMAIFVYRAYAKTGKPYSVEAVSNPQNIIGKSIIYKMIMSRGMRKCISNADGVAYVTQQSIQKSFPFREGEKSKSDHSRFSTVFTSADIKNDLYCFKRDYKCHKGAWKIIHVANSMNSKHDDKGHVSAMAVVKMLRDRGYDVELTFVGEGIYRGKYEKMARDMGLTDVVRFHGYVSRKEDLFLMLKNSDVFLFPSLNEGLPRVLIEAMATGLPCITSNVGGIPELISSENMFMPLDTAGMADRLAFLFESPDQLNAIAYENYNTALKYSHEKVQQKRKEFYQHLRTCVEG